MLLKRLQVQGYKTFANKTEFFFDEGITAVVGPNGSGKSNVADAIRWVLGEQSITELRGKRTTDMIWAGSPSRPRAGMASAILTLDNREGWLPIDYAEVEIGRKAYRSGENEYSINGQRVRLKDVRGLLATSGLARRTYTMIGQGLIDRALSLKSDERRALFEEAAGISHYKARRAETLRRLQETQRNIERVNDVLGEIRPRLNSLKRQANRAKNHAQLMIDMRKLLRVWYGYRWEASRVDLRGVRANSVKAESKWKETRRKLVAVQERTNEARKQLNTCQTQINQKDAARESLREQLEHARRQVAILTERQTLVSRQLSELKEELPDLQAQRGTAQTELNASTLELEQAQTQFNSERELLNRFEATYQTQQSEITRWQKTVRNLEMTLQKAQRSSSQAEGQLSQLRERLAEREGESFDSAEIEQGEQRITELQTAIDTLKAQTKTFSQERHTLSKQRQGLIRELKQMRRSQTDASRKANGVGKEVARLEGRAKLLDQMRQTQTNLKGNAKITGRIANLLTIPSQFQPAIEAALPAINALIVADEASLWQLLRDNPKENLSAISAASQPPAANPHPHPQGAGVQGWASDLVDSAEPSRTTAWLSRILIVETAQQAYKIAPNLPSDCLAVALDGRIVTPSGLLTQRNVKNSVLTQEKAWREAVAAVEKKMALQAELQALARQTVQTIEDQQVAVDKLSAKEADFGRKESKISREINDQQRTLDRARQQLNFQKRQRDGQADTIRKLQKRIAELETTMGSGVERSKQATVELDAARVKLSALPIGEAQAQRNQQKQQIAATQTIVAGRRAVVDSRRATLNQVENRLRRQQQRLDSLQNQQREINLDQAKLSLDQLETRMTQLTNELSPLRALRDKVQAESSDLEIDMSIAQRHAHKAESAYTEARLALSHQTNQIDNLRERIKSDLGIVDLAHDDDETVQTPLPMNEVVEKLPTVETLPDGIEAGIQKRRAQLQRMGAINPDAPQEYEDAQERFQFLTDQIEDLVITEKQLRKVITELDTLTSQEFSKTVRQVNGVFGDMFTQLFGGGSAELHLTNPDDLTLSGVDIIAQLPRRRAQGLGLLSGGERSLTAAALIFALLKVTPPPFCVMDEVDAALDEANINRFRDALRGLSLNTQFIVITHNRGTVQASNTIYGISMGSDSVSQVISIKPEDYVKSETIE
ncbi:MAG: chromosome segregation protein SMC [Candidatus Promineifilaceae bacterium]